MAERVQLSDDLRHRLLDRSLLPTSVTINAKSYAVEEPVKAGFKGAVWRVRDEFGRLRAVKLATYDDYQDRSYLQEMTRASLLDPYDVFAKFIDAGLVETSLGGTTVTFVGFVEEWVPGTTLDGFLASNANDVTVSFFLAYVRAVSNALSALRTVGMRHDDMHAGNVMISPPPPGNIGADWRIRIIDTGSLKPSDTPTHKAKDDHQHFVDHLVAIHNAIRSRRELSVLDRRFLREVVCLLSAMLDDDPNRWLRDPRQIVEHFDNASARSNAPSDDTQPRLLSPFEFISAEHIADDRILLQIFARSCPWLSKVAGPDPCLVTGPRGCGKSTIFRWLSLKAHLHKPAKDIDELRIAGFYVSCSSDLQNRLGWISTEAIANRFRREILHYFNLLLLREVIQTLEAVARRSDREEYWGFSGSQEARIHAFVMERIGRTDRPHVQGVSLLAQVREELESEMFLTHARMRDGLNLDRTSSESLVGDLTALMTQEIAVFQRKKIAFLIDDFSAHRLPAPVQSILNQVIWERRASHVFKLSSEKFGAVLVDPRDATADLAREMIEIDCGREFIALDDPRSQKLTREFIIDLLNHRLTSAGYAAAADILIGRSPRPSLAKSLLEGKRGRTQDAYYGLERIADLCSGDIATLLLVFRRIFDAHGIIKTSSAVVPPAVQDRCVREVSREMLEAIRYQFPCGHEMYDVVAAFGNLVRNVLEQGKLQKKGKTFVPTQCPRIEIDKDDRTPADTLTGQQQSLADELLRRAVFIDMGPGLSRHVNVLTLRWNLRRIYLPAFGAALAKTDAVKRSPDWFKFFLTNAKEACEQVWRTWPRQNGPLLPTNS